MVDTRTNGSSRGPESGSAASPPRGRYLHFCHRRRPEALEAGRCRPGGPDRPDRGRDPHPGLSLSRHRLHRPAIKAVQRGLLRPLRRLFRVHLRPGHRREVHPGGEKGAGHRRRGAFTYRRLDRPQHLPACSATAPVRWCWRRSRANTASSPPISTATGVIGSSCTNLEWAIETLPHKRLWTRGCTT